MDSHTLNSHNQYALPEEIDWITTFTSTLRDESTVVMLGAGPGVFGLAALEGNPKIRLYVVDHDTIHWAAVHIGSAGYHAEFVVYDSADYASIFTRPVDFLIVDADHSREGVTRDILAWFPYVQKSGFIFFHDYLERPNGFNSSDDWTESGVAQAIHDLEDDRWEFVEQTGISVVYRKV